MKPILSALAAIAVAAPAIAAAPTLDSVLAGAQRSDANKARDQFRHPKQTLAFFGIKPTMNVIEVSPGGGWYTEILAPYLRDAGTYTAIVGMKATDTKPIGAFKTKFADARYDRVKLMSVEQMPAGTADLVVTFRNVHNWRMGGYAPAMFAGFFKALKPGGTLGLVEHRLPESRPDADMEKSGYIKTSTVVKLAEDAGFKLVAKSEINANPKDDANHPEGVWTLPPTYQMKDADRAKYAAIGESDRMTLKFVKPKK